ncbi:MAG: dipicolinate synthase, partial [Lachnospiraceae bacterium]|nr:dipicolinate synthase [Lachnospiraceae bacterium]
MTKYDIAILGGDRRTAFMAPIFAEKGYRVICFRTVPISCAPSIKPKISFTDSLREALDSTPVFIGGIPFAKSDCLYCENDASDINLSEIQRTIHKHQKIFAGVIPESFRQTSE